MMSANVHRRMDKIPSQCHGYEIGDRAMLGTRNLKVERFGERVDWCISNLEPDDLSVELPFGLPLSNAIRNRAELWALLAPLVGKGGGQSNKTWERAVGPKGSGVSDAIVRAIVKIYPDMTSELLTTQKYSAFNAGTDKITQARKRWHAATEYITENRPSLAALGKQYHSRFDEVPGFPLIAKRDWLLKQPQGLTENSKLPERDMFTIDPIPARLEGLNVGYQAIATRALGRRRLRWNGDSYRLLKIESTNGELTFTFGPTKYFNYVDSLEAMAAELADHALNHPGLADLPVLPRRGPPDQIFDFRQRSAFAGVNCILFLKNYYRGYKGKARVAEPHQFVLHDRRGDALEARNTIHVVPAGGHQPAVAFGNNKEWSIWRTVVREFCEELFNKEEASKLIKHGGDFTQHPEIKPLVDMFFRKSVAKVFLMGVGLDPVTTKPEILVALVIDWEKVTGTTELHFDTNYEGTAQYCDLSRDDLLLHANMPRPKPLLPAGKACLLLAAESFDLLINSV
jgi:hypothetical protein